MRKLFIVIIYLITSTQVFPQSYRVNFFQTTPAYFGISTPDIGKSILNTFKNNSDEIYFSGNYTSNNFSYIAKYNSKGEKIFTYNFQEQLFSTSGFVAENSLGQLIVVGQKYATNTVCLRVICFDSNMNILWDIITPPNPESVSFYISDVKFDSVNDIYLSGEFLVSSTYHHAYFFKYKSTGTFLWQKIINTSTWASNTPNNGVFKINANSIFVIVKQGIANLEYFSFYELNSTNGDIIKNRMFNETWQFSNWYTLKIFNNSIYLGSKGLDAYWLRKINLNFDTVWTIRTTSPSCYFELDKNENIYVSCAPEAASTASYDLNGNQRWIRNNSYGTYFLIDSNSVALYGPGGNLPVITKFDFNANLIFQSETFNPYLNLKYLYKNSSNKSEFKIIGTPWGQSTPINPYFNTMGNTGSMLNSIAENYFSDYTQDFKLFNLNLYLSGSSIIKQNTSTAFISKHSTNGSLQWNKNIFNNTNGTASINNVAMTSSTVYGAGELFDTTTIKNYAALVGLDNNGNLNFNYSFKNILNNESSGKIVKIYNSSVFVAGQYKDSLNRNKIFLAKNIGNENIWTKKINSSSSSSDSLVNFSLDQFDNCYVSYNSISTGLSSSYTVLKYDYLGNLAISKTTPNANGIYLKKSEIDGFGNIYTIASTKINGNYDLLIQKIDSNGTSLWIDNYNNSFNSDDIACDLVIDLSGNVIVASNFLNSSQRLDAFTMKISSTGERVWNKTYNSVNKFVIKKLSSDDLYCYYLTGFITDATNNTNIMTLEYDKDGVLRYTFNYNQRDPSNLLSFSNDYLGSLVTNVQGGQKFMYTASNVNRIGQGSDVKINVFNSTITSSESNIEIPKEFVLQQNYPNPFNPNTIINYQLTINSFVTLNVYDVNGRLVKELVNQKQSASNYSIDFDGSGLPSGTYIYRLQAGDFSETKKMVLLK